MYLRKYNEQELKDAISASVSIRESIIKLNLAPYGGNYRTIKKSIEYYKIDTSHFTGQNISGRKLPKRRLDVNEYLINGSTVQSNKLRRYLLEANIFEHKCYKCNLFEWNNQPIPLELEHINGINNDNRLDNLTLLCPNCHAQTSTYRGKNIKKLSSVSPSS